MNYLRVIGFKSKVLPKNLIGFDFVNFQKDSQYEELINFNNFKEKFSEKIFRFNEIKLKHLYKASKIMNEYLTLEKEIWGN